MTESMKRLVIASNRLPIVIEKHGKKWLTTPGSGGLVTALAPVLKNRGGLWIGWPGILDEYDLSDPVSAASEQAGFSMIPVSLSTDEFKNYYQGLSNEVIWPLFHDLQSYCNFEPGYWQSYREVNSRFASIIASNTTDDDFIWVHDYHLFCVAGELRKAGVKAQTGFFLHIPFPPIDIFMKLPWRYELLRCFIEYNLIGFQTLRDRRNFIQCLRVFMKDVSVQGKGQVVSIKAEGRQFRVGAFPIGIDYKEITRLAGSSEVAEKAWLVHEEMPDRKIILGIDRLDYTKGIIYRLKSFRKFLESYPELRKQISLVQIVVPSRRNIPVYEELKTSIERLISDINGRFTTSGWVPIHYYFRSFDKAELFAYYRTAEIALITPLKDGMNLVAKEYCASNTDKTGVLILSEFAGASSQLHKGALMVNPYHIEAVAEAIHSAYLMSEAERNDRMTMLQQGISRQDIFWWVNSFLNAAISSDLDDFPLLDEYVHSRE